MSTAIKTMHKKINGNTSISVNLEGASLCQMEIDNQQCSQSHAQETNPNTLTLVNLHGHKESYAICLSIFLTAPDKKLTARFYRMKIFTASRSNICKVRLVP